MVDLSVIVAAPDAGPNLRECLSALAPQLPPAEMEIVVVDGSERERVEQLIREFPSARFLRVSAPNSVPGLWSAGIAAAQGGIVALTIENCVPAPDWARRVLTAHSSPWPAVGGAIEIGPKASLVDWAVYFCRYSSYMLPFSPRFLDDLPGDNCSYKREGLDQVRGLMSDGFWETFIHYEMRSHGEKLLSDPLPVVTYHGGISAWTFFRRRYIHGRYFSARRGRDFTPAQRLMRAVASPVIPLLLLNRITGRVWRNGRHRSKYLAALPLVICFLLAWAAGEGLGYVTGPTGIRAPCRD